MAKKKLPQEVKLIQEYKKPKIDYNTQKSISFSQLNMYTKCPHQWYLSYVKNLAPYTPSVHATFGTALHETVQEWLDVIYNKTAKEANEMDLSALLLDRMKKTYKKERYNNGHKDFSTPEELTEFHNDGVQILDFLKKKRATYFSTKNTYLVGIEVPIVYPLKENIFFKGYIDLVFWNKNTEEYTIIDIKTSTSGWNKYAKKDDVKISQILLYKEYFAKQFNTDVDKINVEYFIVRRKLPDYSDFPIKRVQEFAPASGKIKRGKAIQNVNNFIEQAFKEDGSYDEDKRYLKNPSKNQCRFCPFNDSPLCPEAIK